MTLKTYKNKRKFENTPEPQGQIKQKNGAANFVIQKHAASHLHYDFRLESAGVLKSWAVPKGIPEIGEKHLAIMVEDHPVQYQHFEGVIPKGNYGAGTVMIWDKGKYMLKDKNIFTLNQKITKGEFSFTLEGEKIKGNFSMVKLKNAENNAWLFIKNSGVKNSSSELSAISGKSMKELGEKIIAPQEYPGAKKSKMPEFIFPMLAKLETQPFDKEKWFFEIKWDGYRILARKEKEHVKLFSRKRQDYSEKFLLIAESLKKIKHTYIIDGEIVVIDKNGKTEFQLLQNYPNEKEGTAIYYVFDLLYLDGYDLKQLKLEERRKILHLLVDDLDNVRISEVVEEKGRKLFEAVRSAGGEGIVAKNMLSSYAPHVRSDDWLKIKTTTSQEAVICGFTQPRKGRKKFGALILGVYANGKLNYIGHTGTGFNEKMLIDVYEKMLPLKISKSPFVRIPKTNTPATWIRPVLVCNVKFSQWTKEGLMRHPVFLGLREDKDSIEVTREEPESYASHERMFVVNHEKIKLAGHELALTNLAKIFWPADGYTKKDLIEYYRKIAPYILPYLKNKPQSLNRFPNGITGKNFFQKDFSDAPKWVKSIKIFSESEKKNINYLLCQNSATLVWLANLGCIELNVWNSSIENLENPDYLVLDIDPQNATFAQAIKVAREIKKILDAAKLEAFCKTSGQRGLHVLVPLGKKYSHEQAKDFAYLVCKIAHRKFPEFTSLERKPANRKNKIYLDYLQNRIGQTMASAYCLRPWPKAPVSTPISWQELNSKLDPKKFNIETIFFRLKKVNDPWKNFFMAGKKVNLNDSLKLLEKYVR